MNNIPFLLAFLLPVNYILCGVMLHQSPSVWTAIYPVVASYIFFGIIDYVFGERYQHQTVASRWANLLPVVVLPTQVAAIIFGAWVFVHASLSWQAQAAWLLSTGFTMSSFGITVGHELVHRQRKWQRVCGGLLLASVSFGSFKVEHVWGHHAHVATPLDPSSAAKGDNVYAFVPRAIVNNFIIALQLSERQRIKRGQGWWGNELYLWYSVSALFALCLTLWLGALALWFFLAQSLIAIIQLELINFIEHYGLRRQLLANGQYERVRPVHSWNSSYQLQNWFLFNLMRHSDHHAHAARPYPQLVHHQDAPQLPAGYGAMVLLSLIPPLWCLVMDKRIPKA